MQSRLATAARRSCWLFSTARDKCLQREFVAAAASYGRTADPAIHFGEVEKGPDVHYNEPLVRLPFKDFSYYQLIICRLALAFLQLINNSSICSHISYIYMCVYVAGVIE